MHIILLDLYHRGHHRSYVEMLCRHWVKAGLTGRLTVMVPATFTSSHADLAAWVRSNAEHGLEWVELGASADDLDKMRGIRKLIAASAVHKAALNEAISLRPDHICCLFFDHCQQAVSSLASELDRSGIGVSGILFRATAHYPATSWREKVTRWRKIAVLRASARSSALRNLFALDPFAVEPLNKLLGREVATFLPDGTRFEAPDRDSATLRREYDLAEEDSIVLMAGALGERKGVFVTLSAFEQLPAPVRAKTVLVLAGKTEPGEEERLKEAVATARQSGRVLWIQEFITDARFSAWFSASDVVMAPYQFHVGSSGILIRAAHAQKPVVGSDYGLVGLNISTHRLGLAVDSSSADAVSLALEQSLTIPHSVWDSERAAAFAQANSDEQFSTTIFEEIGRAVENSGR